MAQELGDSDDFDVVNIESESDSEPGQAEEVLLHEGRVFIVSTARASGGHRPSCTFEGLVWEVCNSATGPHLQQVFHASDDAPALSLSLRYEPPSPKFSSRHPESVSYRVKLLHGPQFIYLHRGLPKVCLVDRAALAVSWGALQLVMRDEQQLDSVLAVLKYTQIQDRQLWAPEVRRLWLQADSGSSSSAFASTATAVWAPTPPELQHAEASSSEVASAAAAVAGASEPASSDAQKQAEGQAADSRGSVHAEVGPSATQSAAPATEGSGGKHLPGGPPGQGPRRWTLWSSIVQRMFPACSAAPPGDAGAPPPGNAGGSIGAAGAYGGGLLLGAAVVAVLLWRMRHKAQ